MLVHRESFSTAIGNVTSASRRLLGIVYLFAGIFKLNSGYFNSGGGCAWASYQNILVNLPFLPEGEAVKWLLIVASAGLELAAAGFFLTGRSPKILVLVLALFHFCIALDTYQFFMNFTATMWTLILLQCSPEEFPEIDRKFRHRLTFGMRTFACGVVSIELLYVTEVLNIRGLREVLAGSGLVYFVLFLMPVMIKFRNDSAPLSVFLRSQRYSWVILFLALLNGLSPLIGLKTRTGFNMYANLRLESDFSNHFIFPRSLDVLGELADNIEVLKVDSSTKTLRRYTRHGMRITRFELERSLSKLPSGQVVIRDKTGEHLISAADYPPYVGWKYLKAKFVFFRPLGPLAERFCLW